MYVQSCRKMLCLTLYHVEDGSASIHLIFIERKYFKRFAPNLNATLSIIRFLFGSITTHIEKKFKTKPKLWVVKRWMGISLIIMPLENVCSATDWTLYMCNHPHDQFLPMSILCECTFGKHSEFQECPPKLPILELGYP